MPTIIIINYSHLMVLFMLCNNNVTISINLNQSHSVHNNLIYTIILITTKHTLSLISRYDLDQFAQLHICYFRYHFILFQTSYYDISCIILCYFKDHLTLFEISMYSTAYIILCYCQHHVILFQISLIL